MKRNLPFAYAQGSFHIRLKRGFTLIEILVAIGLVMILTGAGIGTLRQSARRKAVEAAAEDIAAVLHQAQTYAASGNKINCTQGYPLTGWQVEFTASDYKLQEVCPGSGGTPYTIKSGQFLDNITPSTLPSPNPILFRVLNQGTNIVGSTGIVISGFGITKAIGVTSTGEVNLSYTPGAGPTPPAPPTSCNLISRCSAQVPGQWVSYAATNPPTCTTVPGANCPVSCTVGSSACVCQKAKTCCTTVLGAAGLDCASQSYVTIWNQVFAGATVKLGDARGYKSLRVRFTAPRSGSLGYCTGYYCTFYTTVNFTNQTAVSLPASTANSLVKINYDCKCRVILEGIVDPSYVAPPPAPLMSLVRESFGSVAGEGVPSDWKGYGGTTITMVSTADEPGVPARPSPDIAYMQIKGGEGWISREIYQGYIDLTLKYSWRGDNDAPSTDYLQVGYCKGGCGNNTFDYLLASHALTNLSWNDQQISLPDTVDKEITIIFDCNSSSAGKHCRVDDVSVEGRKFSWE